MGGSSKSWKSEVEKALLKYGLNCFNFSDFVNPRKIGEGRFSHVHKAEWKNPKLMVALKSRKFKETVDVDRIVKE
ncbi:20088_t:CDS:1, partial [Racocetra persica]